jgi:hypothetical protein
MVKNMLELHVGHVYKAKRSNTLRKILWLGQTSVQYDSPAIGEPFRKIPIEKFLSWAGEDITEQMPDGEWRT